MADGIQTTDKSEFNSAVGAINRIDLILTQTAFASAEGNFPKWFDCLGTLNREVKFLLKEVDRGKLDDFFIKGYSLTISFKRNMIYSNGSFVLRSGAEDEFIEEKHYENLYLLLNEWDTVIREYLNALDLLIKKKADLSKAISDM